MPVSLRNRNSKCCPKKPCFASKKTASKSVQCKVPSNKPASTFTPLGFSFYSCNSAQSRLTKQRQRQNGPDPYSYV